MTRNAAFTVVSLALTLLAVASTTPAAPVTLSFAPLADAQVRQASPTRNYGTSKSLGSDGDSGAAIESYLRFSVSGIPTGQSVQSATLRVYVPSDGTASGPSVYAVSDVSWSETTITWNTRPSRATTATATLKGCATSSCKVAASSWMEYDVTPLISGNGTYSLDIGPTPTTDGTIYNSREASSNKPQLLITTSATTDTQPPTAPQNVQVTSTTQTSVSLSWDPSTDDRRVAGYDISIDGGPTSPTTQTSYTATGLTCGVTYTIAVDAYDASGNTSSQTSVAAPTAPCDTTATLKSLIENVTASTARRYTARDSVGNSMDTLKIVPRDGGGYLGVYHTDIGGSFIVKLATSQDLMNWTYVADLAPGSQPTLAHTSDGGYIVAYEADSGCIGTSTGGNCLQFLHYADQTSLLAASPDRNYQAPRTLSNCAEGTPNIYSATLAPDIDHSTIDVGFHYFSDCNVDRQARGVLTNFSSFTSAPADDLNTAIESLGVAGKIGDRDNITFQGAQYNIHEGQLVNGDWASWRVFLYDWAATTAQQLQVHTDHGSIAFANPTYTLVASPDTAGTQALVVTLFLPVEGAGAGEAGELIYYTDLVG